MLIKECKIGAFGHIQDCELKELDKALLIVVGPNETGKSTLFEFLKTMIYGIYPTTAENNSYTPWSGRRLEGSLTYRLADGSEQVISRRLSRAPEGYLMNGERRNIRNQSIPAAAHISRELFDSVYALTLGEMASIRERPWHEIQERLLGELTLDILRPVREVVKELEVEAGSLWRDNNRGKPKSKELQLKIKELRKQARSAAAHDVETRQRQEQSDEIEVRLETLQNKKLQLKSQLTRLERLMPCRKLLTRIEQCRQQVGDESALTGLPEAPEERLRELRSHTEQLEQKIAGTKASLGRLQEEIGHFTEEDGKFLDLAPQIREWASRSISDEQLHERLDEARQELVEAREEAGRMSARILSLELQEDTAEAIVSLSEEELARAVKRHTAIQVEKGEVERNLSTVRPGQSILPSVFLSTLGFLISLLGLFRGPDIFLVTGLVLLALGIAWSVTVWVRKRHEDQRLSRSLSRSGEDLSLTSERIRELLAKIPVPEAKLANPDAFLVNDLSNLKTAIREMRNKRASINSLECRRARMKEELASWIESSGFSVKEASFETVAQLEFLRQRAEKNEIESRHAAVAAADAEESISRLTKELEKHEHELLQLESRLRELGSGDIESGLEILAKRRQALRSAEHYQRSLEEEYPDWERIRDEISASKSLELETEEVVRCKNELEETVDSIQHLSNERTAVKKDAQHLQVQTSVAELESEIAEFQEDLEDVKFRRDQLLLLSRIIKHGDQKFRDKHQPDVLRRASEHLSLITGGRYIRLDVDSATQCLEVIPSNEIHPIPVTRPLSQGIRDQIYLSLRLALVEHLDDTHERLPLFLDEILVNWDEGRRKQGYSVLKKVLSCRQVFVFTCHRWLADEFARVLGGTTVEIPDS